MTFVLPFDFPHAFKVLEGEPYGKKYPGRN